MARRGFFIVDALTQCLGADGLLEGRLRITQFRCGQSNPAFLLEAGDTLHPARYVLRKKPTG